MSKILEKATAHFRNQISGEMRKITVPEWECDIYVRQSSTLREESKILELSQQGKSVEALVESIIVKARNVDGSKMFTMPDKMVFMNEVDPNVIIRIAAEMNNVPLGGLDEVEKN
jgi:hypothetical protein